MGLILCRCDVCGFTIHTCGYCDTTWVRRSKGWLKIGKAGVVGCRACADTWGPEWSKEKMLAEHYTEPWRVCDKCDGLPDRRPPPPPSTPPPPITFDITDDDSEAEASIDRGTDVPSGNFFENKLIDRGTSVPSGDWFQKIEAETAGSDFELVQKV